MPTEPWIGPPAEGEWRWIVPTVLAKGHDVMAFWPANAKHPAGAKKACVAAWGDEVEVVRWGRPYVE